MRNKLFVVASLVIVLSMVLGACATPTPERIVETVVVTQEVIVAGTPQVQEVVITATPAPEEPGEAAQPVLRYNMGTYPDIIDPQKSSFVNEIGHLQMIYEGLTRLDEKLETVPGAAESWEYNEDATEITFHLRPGLKYSDGTILNANRFEYSILRNVDPATAGEYAQITDNIAGAAPYRTADATAEGVDMEALKAGVQVRAVDAAGNDCVALGEEGAYEQEDCMTLVVGLDGDPSSADTQEAAPFMHTVLSLWVVYPAKEEMITEGGDNWWNSSKFQIGNGPFILQNLEPFVRGYFTPNANYWRGVPTYDLEYSYVTDSAVAFEAYKNNEFDIIGIAAEDLSTVQADAQLSQEANITPGSCTFAVMFHQLKEPFTDPKVREAFAYALDREAWVTDVLQGLGAPTLTWIPPGFPGYKEGETRFGFDPEAAKAALAESTYGSAENLPAIEATISDTPRNRTRWEWLIAKWKEVLGVDIKLNPVESTTYTALTKDIETSPQMFLLGWCADYPDPQNWLSVYWHTGAFGERIGFTNTELDKIMEQADATTDVTARMELYQQAQDMLVDTAAVAFFWNNVNTALIKPWVTGYKLTPMDNFPGSYDPLSIQVDASAQQAP